MDTRNVTVGLEEGRRKLQELRDAEARTATEITDLVAALDGVPEVGVFPYWNVDLNYLDLRFLARFAAQHQEKVIAEIEGDLDLVRGDPRLHGTLSRILEEKRAHLDVLKEIGTPPPPKPKPEKKAAKAE